MGLSTHVVYMADDGTDTAEEDRGSPDELGQSTPGVATPPSGESPGVATPPGGESPPPPPESEETADTDGFDPADHEAPFGDFEETSDRVMLIGEIGVYIGYLAVALAVLGIALAALAIQPLARVTLVVSLVLVTVALLIGFFFQMATGGFPVG